MADIDGPRGRNRRPRSTGLRLRISLWIAALCVFAVGVWQLSELFPGQLDSSGDQAQLVKLAAILVLVLSGLVFARQINLGQVVRGLSIWAAIAAVLILGFSFQDEFRGAAARVQSALVPGYAVATEPGVLVLSQSADGHFFAIGNVNGVPVRFLIDTGASGIVLAPSDARRIGVNVDALNFTRISETANGLGRSAPFTLSTMSIGPMELVDVPASINQAEMGQSLLGMSFLRRLESFEFRGRQLILRWR